MVQKANKKQWYIISAISNKETTIADEIKARLTTYGFFGDDNFVDDIQIIKGNVQKSTKIKYIDVPDEVKTLYSNKHETEIKYKKFIYKKISNDNWVRSATQFSNFYPGYIYIHMQYDTEVWHVIRNTSGVLGILGYNVKNKIPQPISDAKYNQAKATAANSINDLNINVKSGHTFFVNSFVEIISGQYSGKSGKVVSCDEENKTVTLLCNDIAGSGDVKITVNFSDIKND